MVPNAIPSLCAAGRALLILASILAGSGCAYSYVDEDGSRRVIGLVDMRISEEHGPTVAGSLVDIRTVGVSVLENAQGMSLTVGYGREVTAALRDHALVQGQPMQLGNPRPDQ